MNSSRFSSLLFGSASAGRRRYCRIPYLAAVSFAVVLVLVIAPAAWAQAAQPAHPATTPQAAASSSASEYVGADTCKMCHEDVYTKQFETTPHYALVEEDKHGCEACHGPGRAHVESGGDPTKIIRFERLSAGEASKRCLHCHEQTIENSDFAQSVHMANGVACIACHSPHKAAGRNHLLVQKQPLLCFGCHTAQRAEFARPFRHRVDVGLIECTDCHNPHGTFIQRQVRTNSAQSFLICTKCHSETQGPFVFEHIPVRIEGCTICHTPHGSTNPRLLRVSNVNILCLQCHTAIPSSVREGSTFTGVPGIPSFHNQAQKYQACTMCHVQIHGSNFSDFFFK